MDNNQKIDLIMRYERKRKIKRIMTYVGLLVFFGAIVIFFQIKNFENI